MADENPLPVTSSEDNRVASRLPYDNQNPIYSSRFRAKPRTAPSARPSPYSLGPGGAWNRFNRIQNKTYAGIYHTRQMQMNQINERARIKKQARRPFQIMEHSSQDHFQDYQSPQRLQKWSHSRGDFAEDGPSKERGTEPDLEVLFRRPRPQLPNSITDIDPKVSKPIDEGMEKDTASALDHDEFSVPLNGRSASEGIHLPISSWSYKAPGRALPKAASNTDATGSSPTENSVGPSLMCSKNNATARSDAMKDKLYDDIGGGEGSLLPPPSPTCSDKFHILSPKKEVICVPESRSSIEYIKISQPLDDEEDDSSEEAEDSCEMSFNQGDEELVEMTIQHYDDVILDESEPEPPTSDSNVVFTNGIAVPSSLNMIDDGNSFMGILQIQNLTNFYYAFVLKTNLAGRHKYHADQVVGSIPPMTKKELVINTTEVGYTSLLGRHDRLIVVGVGMPRRIKNSYIRDYLQKMLMHYPDVGEKMSIKPILQGDEDPSEKRGKISRRTHMSRILQEISSAHRYLQDVANMIQSQNAKENCIIIVMIIAMFLVFICQKQTMTEVVGRRGLKREAFYERTDQEARTVSGWFSNIRSLF